MLFRVMALKCQCTWGLSTFGGPALWDTADAIPDRGPREAVPVQGGTLHMQQFS